MNSFLKSILENPYYSATEQREVKLSDHAFQVMEKKYLRGETAEEMCLRIASCAARARHDDLVESDEPSNPGVTEAERYNQLVNVFYNLLASMDFVPNSPTIMNAGRVFNQLAACFVIPVEDSMEGIFRRAIGDMSEIQRTGGGTGFDFSQLRPKGAAVKSTGGESSGPVSFLKAFNACTDTIKQGGTRRGANMGIMRCDHPDIEEFVNLKSDHNVLTNFNLSVAITDDFMKAVEQDRDWDLVWPCGPYLKLGQVPKVYKTINARDLWNNIAEMAWAHGEPGLIFINKVNENNPIPDLGYISATNPCGEQPLLPYEACNLGSINLSNFFINTNSINHGTYEKYEKNIDVEKLRTCTQIATFFLDCIIDAGSYPLPEIDENVKKSRKIGLGVMGFASLLYKLGVPYSSDMGRELAGIIMNTINDISHGSSNKMGAWLGNFPAWEDSTYHELDKTDSISQGFLQKVGDSFPMRNALTTTIAPTGTISIIADAGSYGIEPVFALHYTKRLADGGELVVVNPILEEYIKNSPTFEDEYRDLILEQVKRTIAKRGSLKDFDKGCLAIVSGVEEMVKIFETAADIDPLDHIRMQAAFQRFIDNAVSKTINFDNSVTVDQIKEAYTFAYNQGCKGITVYRDGALESQPMVTGTTEKSSDEVNNITIFPDIDKISQKFKDELQKIIPNDSSDCESCNSCKSNCSSTEFQLRKRPETLHGVTREVRTGCGKMYVTINKDENDKIYEIFMEPGSSGGCEAFAESTARMASTMLKYDIPVEIVAKQLTKVRCANFRHQTGRDPSLKGKSCPDVAGRFLMEVYNGIESKTSLKEINFDEMEDLKNNSIPITEIGDLKLYEKYLNHFNLNKNLESFESLNQIDQKVHHDLCPDCGAALKQAEGCLACECGFSRC